MTSAVWIAEWWAGWDDGHHTNLRLLTHLQPFPHLAHGFQWASTPPHVTIFTCVDNNGNFFVIAVFIRLGNLGDFIFSSHQYCPFIISTLNFTMQRCHVILESLAYEKMCILILKPCRWQVECPWLSMTCSSDRCTTPQICPPLSWLRCARSALEAHVTRQSALRPLVHNKSLASQQCTWNKSQEWRRGAGQSYCYVKSPIAMCPQPACSVSTYPTSYLSHIFKWYFLC